MKARRWDEERVAAFLAGPVTWAPLLIFVLIATGLTISYLDIGLTMGETTADGSGSALSSADGEQDAALVDAAVDGELAAGGGALGEPVFAANCAACHGASGEGGVGPALAGRSLSASAVTSVVESGRGAMPSFSGTLTRDEVQAVAAYVSGLGPDSPSVGEGDDQEAAAAAGGDGGGSVSGGSVFAANCAACHGSSGQGGVGPALAGRSLSASAVTSIVGSGRGAMPSFSGRLTSEQVQAVAAYVSGLGGAPSAAAGQDGEGGGGGPTTAAGGGGGGSVSGGSVFAANCAACHGSSGEGGVGPALAGRSLSPSVVTSIVGSGRGAMPGFSGRLTPEQVQAVAAYVSGLGSGTATAGGGGSPTTATGTGGGGPTTAVGGDGGGSVSGGSVFAANCAACHGSSGEGGVGPALAGRSLSPSVVTSIVGSGRGAMPGFSGRLTPEQVQAVAAYVSGLGSGTAGGGTSPTTTTATSGPTQPTGATGAFATFCSGCHGPDGRGTELGRDLRGRDADDVIEAVRFGEDEMPAFPSSAISDAQLVEIIAYVQSIKERDG